MSRATEYRENARKIRQLVGGINGAARVDALTLAEEYESIAENIEGDFVAPSVDYVEKIAALIDKHGSELLALRKREHECLAELAEARRMRVVLEAKVAAILEVSEHLTHEKMPFTDSESRR